MRNPVDLLLPSLDIRKVNLQNNLPAEYKTTVEMGVYPQNQVLKQGSVNEGPGTKPSCRLSL